MKIKRKIVENYRTVQQNLTLTKSKKCKMCSKKQTKQTKHTKWKMGLLKQQWTLASNTF
jgi:hypothetical protein